MDTKWPKCQGMHLERHDCAKYLPFSVIAHEIENFTLIRFFYLVNIKHTM